MDKVLIAEGRRRRPGHGDAPQRAGLEAVVYEAHVPGGEEAGSTTVASNGLDALAAIGADGPVLAAGFPTPANVLLSSGGRRLGTVSTAAGWPTGR